MHMLYDEDDEVQLNSNQGALGETKIRHNHETGPCKDD